ncbi:hypothetical protein JL2886_02613 [Phaeobacter gallaeciensis]|uniref:DUF4062 domain-containing protein n=1 Tax=Phaeobacter gallaeciensis TaxID=60890 RepID=A0A1B0ZTI7_9RHOB|nr:MULTISPECIES: DUF4062 domain-containing protein [Phaeobacter]MDF1773543.1 DUF4062 domain-containing protein [Pseudophaeobacter sp. bin_em_oilr2.035]MEE2633200.1 DUF4062 domain-containing protein [Pseudomonadota bacterium]ANP37502.1 hypothetical protein JL2886_02613 [Phaeobacter gallaeciensis]MDE4144866.1 DUF4062 domain-containing protein [Phaeobacter gallaeciensis]MDE4157536.1 DUF4062 domain-containing protein [Phaeobacter gallaeciensis]
MAKDIKIYEVFISSPSDVSAERDVVQDALDLVNQVTGLKSGFLLRPIRWEQNVVSQIGNHPQEIINTQVGDEYDIFIGILCSRFGRETEKYKSGTEEEFFNAYGRKKNGKNGPEILMYFKDPRKSEAPIEAEQFLKVAEFKEKISSLGIYSDFDSHDSLKTLVVAALTQAIDRLAHADAIENSPNAPETTEKNGISDTANSESEPILFDEDIGLFDLSEIVFEALDNFTDTLNTMAQETEAFGLHLTDKTSEIENLQSTGDARRDQRVAKAIIEETANEMQRYAGVLDTRIPDARRYFSSAISGMQHAILISSQDGLSNQQDITGLTRELTSIKSVLNTVHGQVSSFQESITSIPRMTSKLNQGKRRVRAATIDLLDFLSDASKSVDTALAAILSVGSDHETLQ